ncbi:hypothetical protein [Tsuneonella rigui]|uniref:hypothetical protein n=1 Tax=Tsuneonella rigui TaxID=1708790 RepID=UPI000F7DB65E|nr:hypothetical protein [Tsuneonella rigui]
MTLRFLPLALLLTAPALAQEQGPPKPLSLQQASALKCSAAFAVGATMQARGQGSEWPALGQRGREFFVRASAQIMDETGRTRDQVAVELSGQAKQLGEPGALAAAMRPCLLLLDASGL